MFLWISCYKFISHNLINRNVDEFVTKKYRLGRFDDCLGNDDHLTILCVILSSS